MSIPLSAKKNSLVSLVSGLFMLLALSSFSAFADDIIYSEGFETDNGDYTADGDVFWEWGTPDPAVEGPTGAHSGNKCWGTDLNANAPYEIGSISSSAISLRALSAGEVARVRFYAYIDIDMEGRGRFEVSNDSTNWKILTEYFQDMEGNLASDYWGESQNPMTGGWQPYTFDVSAYAGGNIYLRFYVDTQSSYNPGFFIDDIAITIYGTSGDEKKFTLEAQEDDEGSCPWIFPWNGTKFVQDNDIYSVARYPQGEYTDFYLLQQPLVATGNLYELEVREIEEEDSWTDMVGLLAVDHDSGVKIGADEHGNVHAYRPADLLPPVTALDSKGNDVRNQVDTTNDIGYQAYGNDYLEVDFGSVNVSQGARVVLRVKGFLTGTGDILPFTTPPAIIIQTLNQAATWQEVGRLKPRFAWSTGVYDLSASLPASSEGNRIRLVSISHGIKYHEIDFIGLSVGPEPSKVINQLDLASASAAGVDLRATLDTADDSYLAMQTGDSFSLAFTSIAQSLAERDFIFISEGYYIPRHNTFYVYTWDGANWALRDGYSFINGDEPKEFNLSLFLPDPSGEYKVRIWQNYSYSSAWAKIDQVGLQVAGEEATLTSARDLRNNQNVMAWVNDSDNYYFTLNSGFGFTSGRNRWSEYHWFAGNVNLPPTTSPVVVDGTTISWTYSDSEGDPQVAYEIEIWTSPGGNGDNLWNPTTYSGAATSITIDNENAAPLKEVMTYYIRVKAFDGSNWGSWSERMVYVGPKQTEGIGQENYRLVSVPLRHVPGDLAAAISSGVPKNWIFGLQGDIHIMRWDNDTLNYDPLTGNPPHFNKVIGTSSTDLAGQGFWRIVRKHQGFNYTGDPVTDSSFMINLKPGWNIFGFPFSNTSQISLNNIYISNDSTDWKLIANDSQHIASHSIWEYEDRNNDSIINDDSDDTSPYYDRATYIEKGYAYWLWVNTEQDGPVILKIKNIARLVDSSGSGRTVLSSRTVLAADGPPPPAPPAQVLSASSTGSSAAAGGGCFIATAAFGSPVEKHVTLLKEFRDQCLLPTSIGRDFVAAYYRYSPPAADYIAAHENLRRVARWSLLPLVGASWLALKIGLLPLMLLFLGMGLISGIRMRHLFRVRKE